LAALVFLYRHVLDMPLEGLDVVVRARGPLRLPVVLTRDEVRAVIERLDGAPRLMVVLLYGAGLRLLECVRLRIKDVDFGRNSSSYGEGRETGIG
jgi:integrase